ncbi:Shedu immune nuclease family protein [Caulobacter soli]|uniref:Shedu immune nuclease family protein n=1 Tax=Caulobacter soli TaxID=2708539 RepID=UPI0013EAC206|nr:Shedu immune nuclease family protein [Caulobacter soli]
MPSVRPSVFNQRERADGGPFLLIEPVEAEDGFSVDIFFTDTPPDQRAAPFPAERLLNVKPDILLIFPLNVRTDSEGYLGPKYEGLQAIAVTRRVDTVFPRPENQEDVEGLLELLPNGFAKDFRQGLGLLWEYRAITEAFRGHDQFNRLIIHHGNDARINPPFFELGINRFHELRREINRISARHQRDSRRDKGQEAYHALLHAADPQRFPRLTKALRADAIADATSGGRDLVSLSKRDRRAAVGLVRSNLQALAQSDTDALLSLKSDIEQVTLQQLIDRFKEMLGKGLPEGRWQAFLMQNPFILSLAFAVPALIVQGQAYAGGKRLNGRGGKVADFLCASASTGNLAIVEIKKPGTDLLAASPYRGDDVYAASGELSGTIAQVLDQRLKLQRELPLLKEESQRPDIHDYGIRCIMVAGRTPDERARQKSFELLRSAMVGVTVLTFDELLARLEEIHAALGSGAGEPLRPDGEAPF